MFTGRLLLSARPDVKRKKGREDSVKEQESQREQESGGVQESRQERKGCRREEEINEENAKLTERQQKCDSDVPNTEYSRVCVEDL